MEPPPHIIRYAGAVSEEGDKFVILSFTTPYGEQQYMIPAEAAFEVAKNIRSTAQNILRQPAQIEVVQNNLMVPGDN